MLESVDVQKAIYLIEKMHEEGTAQSAIRLGTEFEFWVNGESGVNVECACVANLLRLVKFFVEHAETITIG